MQNELEIPAPWRAHIAQQLAESQRMKRDAAVIESEAMRIARTLAAEAKIDLPPDYKLHLDGSKVTWETPNN